MKRRVPTILAASALVLTACGSDDTDKEETQPRDEQSAPAHEVAEPLVTTYDGGLLVLDGTTLEVIEDIPLEGFNRLNAAGDERHVLVSTSAGFQVLDAVGAQLTEATFAAEKPGHVRTPGYLKGKIGWVESLIGAFPNPEEPGALDLALALG